MPLTVVVGGQYGSEGKGKMVAHLVMNSALPTSVVRCGGSNAGHTAHVGGRTYRLRQLPTGVVAEDCKLFLAAGMLIDLEVLSSEIATCGVAASRLRIDRNAAVISDEDKKEENRLGLRQRIASTLSGTGAATARKVLRDAGLRLAKDIPELREYIGDVSRELNDAYDRGEHVIVEGTQGFGLSLHHTQAFPFATSRDTTAAAFLADAGLSPLLVTEVVLVLRTYPIRVGGNSGPMYREITWREVARRSGCKQELAEYTTVTGTLRRVGEFDWHLAERSVRANRPTALAIHGLDYLDYTDCGKSRWDSLGCKSRTFVQDIERRLQVPVRYLFTGPGEADLIDRRVCKPTCDAPSFLARL